MRNSTGNIDDAHSDSLESEQAHMQSGTGTPGGVTAQKKAAIANAVDRLMALGTDSGARVYVDDENRLPSYARHVGTAWTGRELDDEELDYAIGWLPAEAFLNDDSPWPGSYNPYITIAHLRTLGAVK